MLLFHIYFIAHVFDIRISDIICEYFIICMLTVDSKKNKKLSVEYSIFVKEPKQQKPLKKSLPFSSSNKNIYFLVA